MVHGNDSVSRFERILGVNFFNGPATEAVEFFLNQRGLLVVPASPALTKLRYDQSYRAALQGTDVALLDSSLVANAWKRITGRPITSISGIAYLNALLRND